jgi:enediyne biosynthesis protein E4
MFAKSTYCVNEGSYFFLLISRETLSKIRNLMKRINTLHIRLFLSCLLFSQGGTICLFSKTTKPNPTTGTGAIQMTPLVKRKDIGAPKAFTLLNDEALGLRFAGKNLTKEKFEALNYSSALTKEDAANGVCAGDYDGDERPDLFFVYPYGGHQLFRNLGGFRFEDVTEKAGLANIVANHWAMGCSFVDHDGDGDLDLFVGGSGDPALLLDNIGDGTFKDLGPTLGLPRSGSSVEMAFADYDLDGDLDGYLVTNRTTGMEPPGDTEGIQASFKNGEPVIEEKYREKFDVVAHPTKGIHFVLAGEYDHLFRNDGTKYTDVSEQVGLRGTDLGLSASWFDYDEDGRPDLYVANDFFGPDRLYHNQEDGRFVDVSRETLPHTPWFSMGTDVADLNNDGLFDLMGSDMAGSDHYRSKLGMGEMEQNSWFLTSARPAQYMRNALYLNAGDGRFLETAFLAGLANTDWTWSLKFGDFDNDGWVDLFGTNGMTHDTTNSDLQAKANALKSEKEKGLFWWNTPPKRDHNFAFRNVGDLRFVPIASEWGLDFKGVSYGAALADFDGDGDLDLAIASLEDPIRLYRNESTKGHIVKIRLKGARRNSHGIGAKVSVETDRGIQVRYLTSCQGYASANEPVIHFGLGETKVIKRLTIRWPLGTVQTFENLPVDQSIVVTEPKEAQFVSPPKKTKPWFDTTDAMATFKHLENNFDDFKVQPLLPHQLSKLGPGMAWGDVDGDGDEDVFLGGASGQGSTLALNDGKGGFTPVTNLPDFTVKQMIQFEDMGSVFLDADADGDLDLYVASGGFDPRPNPVYLRDRLYINNGKGHFKIDLHATPNLRDSGGPVTAADFDHDGDLDLFVGGRVVKTRYPTTPNSRLLRNDAGKFSDVTDKVAPGLRLTGMVTGAIWSDFDDDGWIDLLITHEWGPVAVWKNDNGKLTNASASAGTVDRLGWWTGISAADVDGDGDMDYAVGNLGLNTKYHASKEKPYILYFGDLDGSGIPRIVEACHEGGILFPVRGKSCSTRAMPSLAKKFSNFHAFASATLPQIYAPNLLQTAQRLAINELSSGVLLNNGKGRFSFRSLPRMAQVSACFGLVFCDWDADGHMDLAMAHNFYSPQPETGNLDGGLGVVLRGSGNGNFQAMRADQSGFILPGDAKALALTDLNGDTRPDLVATVNSSNPKVFINKISSGHGLVIRLNGPKGNLRGVGSRVSLHLKSGRVLLGEVHSGSSYLTGSSADIFFSIPEGDEAISLTVRSPFGKTTRHSIKNRSGTIVIKLAN